jgi:hypothetical protein
MIDISKCANEDCPQKENCFRYTVEASDYQTYSEFKQENGECEYFSRN